MTAATSPDNGMTTVASRELAPYESDNVVVTMADGGGEGPSGRVTHCTAEVIRVAFDARQKLSFPKGGLIPMHIPSRGTRRAADIEVIALGGRSFDGVDEWRFRFSGRNADPMLQESSVVALYNRRNAFRVRPDRDEVPLVRVHMGTSAEQAAAEATEEATPPLTLRLLDVSATGCALRLPREALPRWQDTQAMVNVSIFLPREETPAQFDAVFRNRMPFERYHRLGLEFVARRSREFDESEERLMRYIMGRHREYLRKRAPDR